LSAGEIGGLPPGLPAGSPIHINFRLTEDGTLQVTASEPSSGQKLELNVVVKSVMSKEEVEKSKGMLLRKTVS
jgi:molecular chaperone DnaK (HSP70)